MKGRIRESVTALMPYLLCEESLNLSSVDKEWVKESIQMYNDACSSVRYEGRIELQNLQSGQQSIYPTIHRRIEEDRDTIEITSGSIDLDCDLADFVVNPISNNQCGAIDATAALLSLHEQVQHDDNLVQESQERW